MPPIMGRAAAFVMAEFLAVPTPRWRCGRRSPRLPITSRCSSPCTSSKRHGWPACPVGAAEAGPGDAAAGAPFHPDPDRAVRPAARLLGAVVRPDRRVVLPAGGAAARRRARHQLAIVLGALQDGARNTLAVAMAAPAPASSSPASASRAGDRLHPGGDRMAQDSLLLAWC